jgi:hypothetical protein
MFQAFAESLVRRAARAERRVDAPHAFGARSPRFLVPDAPSRLAVLPSYCVFACSDNP